MLLSLLSKRSLEVDSRDAYGFSLRPQHIQGYKNYSCIYQEVEHERSDKWQNFLEQLKSVQPLLHEATSLKEEKVADKGGGGDAPSPPEETCKEKLLHEASTLREEKVADKGGGGDKPCSPEEICKEKLLHEPTALKEEKDADKGGGGDESCPPEEICKEKLHHESTSLKEEKVADKCGGGDESCSPEEICKEKLHHESTSLKEENVADKGKGGDEPGPPDEICKEKLLHEGTTLKEEKVADEGGGGDDTCGSDTASNYSVEEEVRSTKEAKTSMVQTWVQIKPSLDAIDHMMGLRVKKRENMKDKQKSVGGDLSPIKVVDDSEKHSMVEGDESNRLSSEPFPWKEELECLVQGGVPKELRGEVWQAFVGVRTRRVERYYEDLLADTGASDSNNKSDKSSGVPMKWKKQIEKDIPRTFPGHPALDDNGRNSLRRLLLAYARHNPSVGYCQAMNYFAGLLLLLMPEENAFWALVGIIDDYFEGYYSEQMIESQVDQLVFGELLLERFPKLVHHLDYLGVQVTWISSSWFLSIFVNMLPWESVLRVWDVLLYEGNRVMLFRTSLALMELYGPALVTTKDAGDAITLLQSLAGSTFDSSQLVMTACMGFMHVTEARLQELREKHRPAVLQSAEKRSKGVKTWKSTKGVRSKLRSFKPDPEQKEVKTPEGSEDILTDGDTSHPESTSDFDEFINGLTAGSEVDYLPDLQDQVNWLKGEIYKLLEEKKSAVLRAEELEKARNEMTKEDNRTQLISRIEQLEQEVAELRRTLLEKKEKEDSTIEVLLRVEQHQKATEEARRTAEQDANAQKFAIRMLEEKYEKAVTKVAKMEKRVIMAESMLEATLQYETGQIKAQASPGHSRKSSNDAPQKNTGLLSRPFGRGDKNKNKDSPTSAEERNESISPSNLYSCLKSLITVL